jgi:hypothetical protein
MEEQRPRTKKTIRQYMRALHRDVGFLVIGLTVIYCFSGIVFMFRDTSFFKREIVNEKQLSQNLKASQISKALRFKGLKVVLEEGELIHFQAKEYPHGTYNKTTGKAVYSRMVYPMLIQKLNKVHKTKFKANGESVVHWFTTVYAILLSFLAISSFWMFKPGSKLFKRGFYLSVVGGLGAVVLMYFR